jgi:hypothetical protein
MRNAFPDQLSKGEWIVGTSRRNMLDTLEQHQLAGAVERRLVLLEHPPQPAALPAEISRVPSASGSPTEARFASEVCGPISALDLRTLLPAYLTDRVLESS